MRMMILNDQGGDVMNVSDSVTSTLRAQDHGHPPVVCMGEAMNSETCYAIEGNVVDRVSAKNGKGWCENVSPTLNTQDRHAVCYSIDCRNLKVNRELSGTLQSKQEGGWSLNYLNPVVYKNEQTDD